MINLKEFLLKSNIDFDTYALVTYDNKTETTHFTRYNFGKGDWFLESPCELYKVMQMEQNENIDTFCKRYMNECVELEEGGNEEDYIDNFVKPMIINDWLYEIENFQCAPYLPEKVDNIKLVTERECLEYMIKEYDASLINENYLKQNAYITIFNKNHISDTRYTLKEVLQKLGICIKNTDGSWRTKDEIKNDIKKVYNKLNKDQQSITNQFKL